MKRIFAAAAAAAFSLGAHAQQWPAKPIRVIVHQPAGGPTDLIPRSLGTVLAPKIGQPFIVENRPGAGGILGLDACAKAAADGYTFCMTNNGFPILRLANAKLPFDTLKDFQGVSHIGTLETLILVTSSVPASTAKEFFDMARAKPGSVAFSSIGQGSGGHLHVEWFKAKGIDMLHVPYKGGEAALTAVVTGDVQVTINASGRALPMIKAGKLKALAAVGDQPSVFVPGVRSMVEHGYDVNMANWLGLLAPSGVPDPIVRRLSSEVDALLKDAAFAKQHVLPQGVVPAGGTPEQFREFVRKQHELYADLVKVSGVKFEQ